MGYRKPRSLQVLDARTCSEYRSAVDINGELDDQSLEPGHPDEGVAFLKLATGRSRCRCCGEKIAKGTRAIHFNYDFVGCGSWTISSCWIHAEECESVPTPWGIRVVKHYRRPSVSLYWRKFITREDAEAFAEWLQDENDKLLGMPRKGKYAVEETYEVVNDDELEAAKKVDQAKEFVARHQFAVSQGDNVHTENVEADLMHYADEMVKIAGGAFGTFSELLNATGEHYRPTIRVDQGAEYEALAILFDYVKAYKGEEICAFRG